MTGFSLSCSSYRSCSSYGFGLLVATNGGMLALNVWDDANHNGEKDAGETGDTYTIWPKGHSMSVTNHMTYGSFDRDGDNLPDWWEVANGLSTSGVPEDEYADPDNDGLINLHEFWSGTNPQVPDGSNTLLSVVCRSVDDLLNAASPVNGFNKFSDYYSNGSNLVFNLNGDFWLGSIDTTCCSMWQDSNVNIWNGHTDPWHMGGTLISSNHVVYAFHYGLPVGATLYFRGSSGTIYSRELVAYRSVRSDICVGLLNEGLPRNDVKPAKLFPNDYENYLHRVDGVPIIMIDQEEHASVSDVSYCPQRGDRESYFISGRPKSQLRNLFFESCINGDSGSPRFMLVGGELVLVSMAWKRDGAGRGDCYGVFLAYFIDDIQRNMDALKPGSSIETIVLSGFQTEVPR